MQIISTIQNTLPPALPGISGAAFTAFQVLATATSYASETNPETRTQYSKFASKVNAVGGGAKKDDAADDSITPTWPSQIGMLVIYSPALLSSLLLLLLGSPALAGNSMVEKLPISIPQPSPAAVLCAIHFAKRVLEVLFLHKYSGRVDRGSTPSFVGTYYAIVAILVAYASDPNPSDLMMQIGTALFGIGIAGDFYHHYLLASLRKSPGKDGSGSTTKYVAPRGGLFDYVAAPHYLFELIGWLGMAIVSNHLNVYLVFTSMSSYLSGRSVAQNEFNRKKFAPEDWPEDRKNLIPFVF